MTKTEPRELTLTLSIDDINLMLEALGGLPFARVYALIGRMQEQAAVQLRASEAASAGAEAPAVPLAMVASR